jgi:MFS family permease
MKLMLMLNRLWLLLSGKLHNRNLTHNFRMLYFSRITISSATQLMGLFLPIFLYIFLDMSLSLLIFFLLGLDFLYLIFLVYGCKKIMNPLGIKKSLQISVILGALYYIVFFFIDNYVMSGAMSLELHRFWWLLPVALLNLLFRLSHWVPYHTDVAKLTEKRIRASQLSLMEATMMAIGTMMPLVAGLILSYLGYSYLFLLAVSIYLLSSLPLSRLPKVEESFSWTHKQTWKTLLSKKLRPSVIAYAGFGAESVIGLVIWPIFIWQVLDKNYLQVGAISSVIIIATILLQIFVGKSLDKLNNKRLWLRYGIFFYAFGWILKALVGTAFQVFLFSAFHNISRIFSSTSFDTLNYDIAADQGHFVDEYTVIRDMSLLIGKIIMGLFIILIIPFLSLRYIFVVAALVSLLMTLLRQSDLSHEG